MGEGRGGPSATWDMSVGRPSGRGVIQQRSHTLNPPPYQHCICNQLRFAESLWTVHTALPVSATRAVHCCSITATACHEFGMTVVCRSGLTRHEYMRETGALCNLTLPQLPVGRSTSQGPTPNHSCAAWYVMCCSIHTLTKCVVHAKCRVSFEYSTSLDIWNSCIKK